MGSTMKMFKKILVASFVFVSMPAMAQDDIDDILGSDESDEQSTKEEKAAIEEEAAVNTDATSLIAEDSGDKQIIKTLQRKTFLKLKRWEISPHAAFVAPIVSYAKDAKHSCKAYRW